MKSSYIFILLIILYYINLYMKIYVGYFFNSEMMFFRLKRLYFVSYKPPLTDFVNPSDEKNHLTTIIAVVATCNLRCIF